MILFIFGTKEIKFSKRKHTFHFFTFVQSVPLNTMENNRVLQSHHSASHRVLYTALIYVWNRYECNTHNDTYIIINYYTENSFERMPGVNIIVSHKE